MKWDFILYLLELSSVWIKLKKMVWVLDKYESILCLQEVISHACCIVYVHSTHSPPFSGDRETEDKYWKLLGMLIFVIEPQMRSQDHGFIWEYYDIRWLMLMELNITFKPGKNIFHYELAIVIIFKWLQGRLETIHTDSSYERRSNSWINELKTTRMFMTREDN